MPFIWSYVKTYRKYLFLALGLATINQVFSLLDPQIFRLIVDRYASHVGSMPMGVFLRGVGVLVLGSMGVALVSRIAKNFQDYYVNVVTQRVGARLYATSVDHSLSLPYAVFEDQRSGELLQRLQKARSDFQVFIAGSVNGTFVALVGVLFVVIYASTVYWPLGVAYFAMIPIIGSTFFYISRGIKAAQKNIVRETADLAGSTTETIRNVELVKSLGLEKQEVDRLNVLNEKILNLELKKIKLVRALSFVQGSLINAIRSALLIFMMWLIYRQVITFGQFFSLYIYSFFIFGPLTELGSIATQFQEAKASSEAIENILLMPQEEEPASPKPLGTLESIRFENISFSYASRSEKALADVALEINAGEEVAFVGPSGSGKTTTLKLIAGLYRPTGGELFLNGMNSRDIDYRELRNRIGLVAQETQLFAGTIRDNLLFVRPEATDEECLEVLRQAAAMQILERGRDGLDTKIGEGGIKVSGGERQRLAIARALLRRPELLIFDEATSSLDSLTEKEITATIREVSKIRPNLVTILVAHRLSTIQHAKRIYVLERGKIAEAGSHDDLMQKGGLYAAMWREQSAEVPREAVRAA
jgi:ATP-binding cassette subfamily B protein